MVPTTDLSIITFCFCVFLMKLRTLAQLLRYFLLTWTDLKKKKITAFTSAHICPLYSYCAGINAVKNNYRWLKKGSHIRRMDWLWIRGVSVLPPQGPDPLRRVGHGLRLFQDCRFNRLDWSTLTSRQQQAAST